MPTYFFNVHNLGPPLDPVAEELPHDDAAWEQATILAGEVFKDVDGNLQPGQEWTLDVSDQHRSAVFEIHISTKKHR